MTRMTDPAQVHSSAIVIDTHADTPQRFVDEHWNFTDPLNGGMLNYDSAKKGNLDAQFFSIWVDPGQYAANASARRTLELIDGTLEQVRKAPDKLQLCTTINKAVALVAVWTAVVATVGFLVVKVIIGLRVTEEQEREGLDITSHGERAYDM